MTQTSLQTGKMVPLVAIPVLREDSARVTANLVFQMEETVEMLVNPINVVVQAYLVPKLASERFQSMDDLNRSWEGKSPRDTGNLPVVPFVEHIPAVAHGTDPILRCLGEHTGPVGTNIVGDYHEVYNLIWNWRAANRSPDIQKRARLERTLAPAFWRHSRFAHIVPDWDQAAMEGKVALNVLSEKLTVHGIAFGDNASSAAAYGNVRKSDGTVGSTTGYRVGTNAPNVNGQSSVIITGQGNGNTPHPNIWAEMKQNGITVSLADIEQAKKAQWFAKARERYAGHDDDYIIDMLMDGLSVDEQLWRQPSLIAEGVTIFGMQKRFATNGDDLTRSVVNGATSINLDFAIPKVPCGGVIMIVAEIFPEQLFERGRNPFLHARNVDDFPHALRDMMALEPVEAVRNDYIDIDHNAPASTFGFAPMNHQWNFAGPKIGGRFYRPKVDAPFDEDRQRFWAMETPNPVLSEDFYLVTNMHQKPFLNANRDPFEVTAIGDASLTGLTQFGPVLIEASNNYDEVMAEADRSRLPPRA